MIYIFYKVCILYHKDLDKEKSKHMLDLYTNILPITIE